MANNNRSAVSGTIIIIFTLYGFLSQYLLPSIIAGISLSVIINSLWMPRVPPILVYLFVYQFLQVFGGILYADFQSVSLDDLFNSKDASFLVIVTLCQVALMSFFTAKVFKIKSIPGIDDLKEAALQFNVRNVLIGYFISALIFPTLILSTYSIPSLNQLVQSFAVIKKLFILILLFILFLRKTKYRNLIILIMIGEFVLSFASFFSSFKDVFIYIFMVYLTVNPNIKTKYVLRIAPFVAALLLLLVFWSSVKVGYRDFLNQGSRQQEISVSTLDALGYITDKVQNYDIDSFAVGGEILLNRMQYMNQYSAVYRRVPDIIPYAGGENLSKTILFLCVPRSFVDSKAILDPSTKASYYTGRSFANASQGTSISMGYFCDLYIDYGLWLMIIPLLIIAFAIGKAASYIVNSKKYNVIFTYSLLIGFFLSLGTFESDIIFYLGSIRNYLVVMIIGNEFIFPWLNKYIKN